MKMKNKKYNHVFVVAILVAVAFIIYITKGVAGDESITNLTGEQQEEIESNEKKIKQLEEKAEAYRKIIDLKQKQQTSLEGQVEIIESDVGRIQAEIDLSKEKLGTLNEQIGSLRVQIEEKEKIISSQKKLLADLVQVYYEYSQQSDASIIFILDSTSQFMGEEDRLVQTGDKIREMLNGIETAKVQLEDEKKSLESKKKEVTDLYVEQEEKNTELENTRSQKEYLLSQTRGEEDKYQDLLARVEQQKQQLLGDIDELYSANAAELNKLLDSLDKPKSGLTSTSWYYSQKDNRWGNKRIGQSNSLVKDYGCALTSVAMILTYYGESTNPGSLAGQSIYYWDLIVWPDGSKVKLVKNTNHGGVSWSEIDRELDKGNPVIVFIRAKSSGAGHYVVIHHKSGSDYVVHDPYFGSNIYLSSSIRLLEKLYGTSISKSNIDQMILYKKS